MAAGAAQASQVARRGARVQHVLDHLLADDDIEPPADLGIQVCAEVEGGEVEADEALPPEPGLRVAADLGRVAPARVPATSDARARPR